MRNIVLAVAAAAVVAFMPPAQAQIRHFLVAQWLENGNRMCKYDNGTVLNVGYQVCPLSI